MDDVILETVLAPPVPRSIDVISPFGRELMNLIEREYTAKGSRFLPLKPSDTYRCLRGRNSEDTGPENEVECLQLSQVSMFNEPERVSEGEKENNLSIPKSTGIVGPSYQDDNQTILKTRKNRKKVSDNISCVASDVVNGSGFTNSADVITGTCADHGEAVQDNHKVKYKKRIGDSGNVIIPETQFTFGGSNDLLDEDLEFIEETPMFKTIFSRDKLIFNEKPLMSENFTYRTNLNDSDVGNGRFDFKINYNGNKVCHNYIEPIVEITEDEGSERLKEMRFNEVSGISKTGLISDAQGFHARFNCENEFHCSSGKFRKQNSTNYGCLYQNINKGCEYGINDDNVFGYEKHVPESNKVDCNLGFEGNRQKCNVNLNFQNERDISLIRDKHITTKFDYKSVIGMNNVTHDDVKVDVINSQYTLNQSKKQGNNNITRNLDLQNIANVKSQYQKNCDLFNFQKPKIRMLSCPQPKIYEPQDVNKFKFGNAYRNQVQCLQDVNTQVQVDQIPQKVDQLTCSNKYIGEVYCFKEVNSQTLSTQVEVSQTPIDFVVEENEDSGNIWNQNLSSQKSSTNAEVIRKRIQRKANLKNTNSEEDLDEVVSGLRNQMEIKLRVTKKENILSLSLPSEPLLTLDNDWCVSDDFMESLGFTQQNQEKIQRNDLVGTYLNVQESIEAENKMEYEGIQKGRIEDVKVWKIFSGNKEGCEQTSNKVGDEGFKISSNKCSNIENSLNLRSNVDCKISAKVDKFRGLKGKNNSKITKKFKGEKGAILSRVEVSRKPCKVPKTHQLKITDLLKAKAKIPLINCKEKEKRKLEQPLKTGKKIYSLLDFLKTKKCDKRSVRGRNIQEGAPKILNDDKENLSLETVKESYKEISNYKQIKILSNVNGEIWKAENSANNLNQFKSNKSENQKAESINISRNSNSINDHSECKASKLLNQNEINFKIGSVSTNDDRITNNENSKRKWETSSNSPANKKTKFCIPYKSQFANFDRNNERTTSQT